MLDRSTPSTFRPCSSTVTLSTHQPVGRSVFHFMLARLQAPDAPTMPARVAADIFDPDEDLAPIEWSEEEIVQLHWRLLKEVGRLADPETPLQEKFETLRWVFTERENDDKPFSFVSCLRVVGISPLSPLPYCGLLDAEEFRDVIRGIAAHWMRQTLARFPVWAREAILDHPDWVQAHLSRDPQWINQNLRRIAIEGDLFD